MPEEEARWIFQQLLVAIDHCQRLGIANRDIKVECSQHAVLMCVLSAPFSRSSSNCIGDCGHVQRSRADVLSGSLQLDNMMVHGFWPWPTIKLCDFGFSKDETRQSACDTSCGTPEYIAPEVSAGHPSQPLLSILLSSRLPASQAAAAASSTLSP